MKKEKIDLPREIRIGSVKTIWENIFKKGAAKKGILEINLKDVEILDGAGLQLILYLKYISREIPEEFQLVKEQDTLKKLLAANGCSL